MINTKKLKHLVDNNNWEVQGDNHIYYGLDDECFQCSEAEANYIIQGAENELR